MQRDRKEGEKSVMDELISRQSAINAIENTDCDLSSDAWDELTDAIMSVPTADAVEVVRCKDCKWHMDNFCDNMNVIGLSDDDYCSLGERREDAEVH